MRSIYYGKVTSIVDEYNGNRIRVKLPIDSPKINEYGKKEYPWALPLLPKTLQTMPKVGETVVVFLVKDNRESERFYIGPLISQYQFMGKDDNNALSLTDTTSDLPKTNINKYADTFGSFPTVNDVALVGRKGEDVILKEDEINIRCGARNAAYISDGDKNHFGDILFNGSDLAYIQLKYKREGSKNNKSFINIVGDKINLIGTKEDSSKKITNYMRNFNNETAFNQEKIPQTDYIVEETNVTTFDEPNYKEISNKLHQLPYGDVLVNVLETIRKAILNHTHPLGDDEPPIKEGVPCMSLLKTWGTSEDESAAVSLPDLLLSDTVRIS